MKKKRDDFEIIFAGMNKACTFASRLKKAVCSLRIEIEKYF
jgi:hypothetical protein